MLKEDKILAIQNLDIGYKTRKIKPVFSGLNLSFKKGELVALTGKNGIGKSTLLRTITGIQEALAGDICIFGKDIKQLSKNELAKILSFVSTENVYIPNLRVGDLVSLGRFPHTNWIGKLTSNDSMLVHESLELVGLGSFVNTNFNEISDGEKQRALIARALAQDTEIIILDEPVAFLDLQNKHEIINLLQSLSHKKGKFILFSSHDLNVAIQTVDKMIIMKPDSILEGAPEDLILEHQINELFPDSNLSFDIEKGDFVVKREVTGKINLIAEGSELFWTRKALERTGFEVICNKTGLENVIVEKNNGIIRWIYQKESDKFVYNTIYELTTFINSQT